MNLDWRRLKAVVIESDDWGLCAWSADPHAYRVLADTPVFRSPQGRRYGGSTLESAADLRQIGGLLLECRSGNGQPPVVQANMIMASVDYPRLRPPLFEIEEMPLLFFPETPPRWRRPELGKALAEIQDTGVWWPELHGLHHLPETAWCRALRRGEADARRAHEQQTLVCRAVESAGEYSADEPLELKRRNLQLAVEKFQALFGRAPSSFCPPDYHWDERMNADAEALGLRTFQGTAEMAGVRVPRLRRLFHRFRWPQFEGRRFAMPPRIAFEPVGPDGPAPLLGAARTHRVVRETWTRGQPAVVSSHRMNFVHMQPGWAEAGRAALRDLLELLIVDDAMFLVDFEVRALLEHGWSVRPLGPRGALLHYFGVPGEPVRVPVPAGVTGAEIEGDAADSARVTVDRGELEARVNVGSHRIAWRRG